ncbi:MAG: hypothetical protein OM95_00245 [Bdellovibrio sp. ArHS]|uniref:O-antigen ligase family protein n=1 Tax=Bdellovibrio sp. ArHS TaxID=1569284 RepID=UPI000583F39B|nr:O-antigen ligase family protein [Bdellovibrio sp. ArHS]KHD89994.1 MAG: hypothetical protein OM95_00245 [Bdellovibrio sp. ArHS]
MHKSANIRQFSLLFLALASVSALASWKIFDMTMVALGILFLTAPLQHARLFTSSLKPFNYAVLSWLVIVFLGYVFTTPLGSDQWTDLLSFRWILGFYFCVCAAHYISISEDRFQKFSILAIITLSLGLLWQFYAYNFLPLTKESDTRFMGFFHNTNHYSLTISLLWAFTLGWISSDMREGIRPAKVVLFLFAFLCFCLIGSLGRSAWVGCSITALFMLYFYRDSKLIRRLTVVSFAAMAFMFLFNIGSVKNRIMYSFSLTDESATGVRLILWRTNWEIFLDHPLFGVGFYENIRLLPEYYAKLGFSGLHYYAHAHNQYLELLSGSGLFGLFGYLTIFGLALRFYYRHYRKNEQFINRKMAFAMMLVLLTFLFESLTESPFNLREPRNLLILLGGCTYAWLSRPAKSAKLD